MGWDNSVISIEVRNWFSSIVLPSISFLSESRTDLKTLPLSHSCLPVKLCIHQGLLWSLLVHWITVFRHSSLLLTPITVTVSVLWMLSPQTGGLRSRMIFGLQLFGGSFLAQEKAGFASKSHPFEGQELCSWLNPVWPSSRHSLRGRHMPGLGQHGHEPAVLPTLGNHLLEKDKIPTGKAALSKTRDWHLPQLLHHEGFITAFDG